MNINNNKNYILALHSSTARFGVAVLELNNSNSIIKNSTFDIGRKLSNDLFKCVDQVLPIDLWHQIARLGVTTGPGGFTGTRLTISMARIIAQQMNCSLDGVSSFALMAKRLAEELKPEQRENPFWIKKFLNRRGIIAGKYQIKNIYKETDSNKSIEIIAPRLLPIGMDISPAIECKEDVQKDTLELLNISLESHNLKIKSDWRKILPIYPTSPLDK